LLWLGLAITACAGAGSSFVAGRQALLRGEPDNALKLFERVAQENPAYVVDAAPPRKSIWTFVGRAHYNAGRYTEARSAFDRALTHIKDDYVARLFRGLTLLRAQSSAPASNNAFSLQEVTYALREGIAPRRVSTLARERGVAFDLNAETENQLKIAGADEVLLGDLKKMRAERTSSNKPSDSQLNEGTKEVGAGLTGLHEWLTYTIAYTNQGSFWDVSGELRAEISQGLKLVAAAQRDYAAILASGETTGYRMETEIDRVRQDIASDLSRQGR